MLKYKRPLSKESILPDYLHWYEITEEGYIITKDGRIQATFELALPFANADFSSASRTASAFESWICSLPSDICISYEISRLIPFFDQYISRANEMTAAAQSIEAKRAEAFNSVKAYENRTYLTISNKKALTQDMMIGAAAFTEFSKLIQAFLISMDVAEIKARQLTRSETLTYLHSCISTKQVNIKDLDPDFRYDLDFKLSDDEMFPSYYPMVLGNQFVKVIVPTDFISPSTSSAMMDAISSIPGRIRWVSRLITMDKEKSQDFVETKRKRFAGKLVDFSNIVSSVMGNKDAPSENEQAKTDTVQCMECASMLANTKTNIGIFSGFIVLMAKTEEEIADLTERIEKIFTKCGVLSKQDQYEQFASFLGSLPGNREHGYRKMAITTRNYADLIKLTAPYTGFRVNQHMKELTGVGVPLLYGKTYDGSLCCFSPNVSESDVGHTAIFGQTGAGKSILLALMASQFLKYPNSRVILFDKGASALTNFAINQHGAIYRPLLDDTVFQPLQNPNTSVPRCMKFLEACCEVQNVKLDAPMREALAYCVRLLPPASATISVFKRLFTGKNHASPIVSVLENYAYNGNLGGLFDADSDTLSPENIGDVTLFETSELMKNGDACIIPALTYIFSQLDILFKDKRPTLLVLDEAWEYLKHPHFSAQIQEWFRTLRKMNVFVVIATQEISALNEEILPTIISAVQSIIYLPTSGATQDALKETYKTLGASDDLIELIATSTPKKQYIIDQKKAGIMLADFCVSSDQLQYFLGEVHEE